MTYIDISQNHRFVNGYSDKIFTRPPLSALKQPILIYRAPNVRHSERVAERSESFNNMIAGGNHTLVQAKNLSIRSFDFGFASAQDDSVSKQLDKPEFSCMYSFSQNCA